MTVGTEEREVLSLQRVQVWTCDNCAKEQVYLLKGSALNVDPEYPWLTVWPGDGNAKHFCSKNCTFNWLVG